ncbi:hypothetical protein BX600DRAFT_433334 [Xylariales sp. PMI_506]|nr:hypothetical protein BX600DRAFT_433334 [Xylariales sp. PMI_506]
MTTSADAHTRQYSHINGPTEDLLNRFAVSELCKGWPVYRDASEWKNYRDLFTKDAFVWTTWSKGRSIDDFIDISKKGKDKGDFIMHRECGTLVEYSAANNRAVGKMKATITQRFKVQPTETTTGTLAGAEYDVDCDCRFIFFCLKGAYDTTSWKAKYVKLFYEKDKVIPVDGNRAPVFAQSLLDKFPDGYKYLGAAQSTLGYSVTGDLPTARNHQSWFTMYKKMEDWLAGGDVDLWCDDDDIPPRINDVGGRSLPAKSLGNKDLHQEGGLTDTPAGQTDGNSANVEESNGNQAAATFGDSQASSRKQCSQEEKSSGTFEA